MIDNTPYRPPRVADYLLAAEYWHPDVSVEAAEALLPLIEHVPEMCDSAAQFGVPDEAQQDAHCWYYLLLAAEAQEGTP